MSEIHLRIPQQQPEVEAALQEFIQHEFDMTVDFMEEAAPDINHKGADLGDALWQALVVIATIEGTLQFRDRLKRSERVKKLLAIIKKNGCPVYLKIKGKTLNLYQASHDEVMNLLGNKDKD